MLRLATQTFSINIAEVPLRAKTKATSCSPRPADRPTRSCIPRTKGLQAADPLFAECIRKRGTRSRRRSFPCRRFVRNNKLNRYSKLMEDAQYSMNVLNNQVDAMRGTRAPPAPAPPTLIPPATPTHTNPQPRFKMRDRNHFFAMNSSNVVASTLVRVRKKYSQSPAASGVVGVLHG